MSNWTGGKDPEIRRAKREQPGLTPPPPAPPPPPVPVPPSAMERFGDKFKSAMGFTSEQDRAALAEAERQAGALVTSGIVGTTSIAVYANGFVRVAARSENSTASTPKRITDKTPFERLQSVEIRHSRAQSVWEAAASLFGGGTHEVLVLVTAHKVHTITPNVANDWGVKVRKKEHVAVMLAIESAARSVLHRPY